MSVKPADLRRASAPGALPSAPAPTRPAPSPTLEALPAGYRSPRSRRLRARLLAVAGLAVAVGTLFGLVGVHVLLTQNQFRLAQLQRQADVQQTEYLRLRLEVSQLEAPQRIVAAARDQLGMVPATSLTYLSPTAAAITVPAPHLASPATTPVPSTTATTAKGSAGTWAAVKPALTSRP
jgi:cell division protein FtsL